MRRVHIFVGTCISTGTITVSVGFFFKDEDNFKIFGPYSTIKNLFRGLKENAGRELESVDFKPEHDIEIPVFPTPNLPIRCSPASEKNIDEFWELLNAEYKK